MHAVAEIVLPPNSNIEKSIKEVMDYFIEEGKDYAEWWDWYVIGGRFSGHKLEASLEKEKLEKFYKVLKEKNVTVSSLTAGKRELKPASQIPMVDGLWREMFPGKGEVCLLFNHYHDQYSHEVAPQDVCTIAQVPENLTCERLIVAGPSYDKKGVEPKRMFQTDFWNQVEFVNTTFDGKVKPALKELMERKDGKKDYKMAGIELAEDWLVVTVDYHN